MVASEQPHANLIPRDATLVMPITRKASKKELLAPEETRTTRPPGNRSENLFKSSEKIPAAKKRTSKAVISLELAEKQLAEWNQCIADILKSLGNNERKLSPSVEKQLHGENTKKENSQLLDELRSDNERLKKENHQLRHDKQVLHTRLCKLEWESRVQSLKRELTDVKKALSTETRKVEIMQEHIERLKDQNSQSEEIITELTMIANAFVTKQDLSTSVEERKVEKIQNAVQKLECKNLQMTYTITELSMTAHTYGSELSNPDRKFLSKHL